MIHYEACPFCHSGSIQQKFVVKDHSVSGESFTIFECRQCHGAFTQDVPAQEEIGRYYASQNYISHSDTQEGFINKAYHLVRSKTLLQKKNLIQSLTKKEKGSIADIGCGTGAFLHSMQQAGWQTTGFEPDDTARQNAQCLYNISPLASPELYNQAAESFDAVTMWHVLEHVHELHAYLDQVKKILKKEGVFVVAVPNYTSGDAAHYQQYWAAFDVPRHLYHFSPASMELLMKQHGLQVVTTKPMWFDSFYVSMLSEEYRRGKGNVVVAFLNGLISNIKALFDKRRCSSVIYVIKKMN